jgi:hypothetical protein
LFALNPSYKVGRSISDGIRIGEIGVAPTDSGDYPRAHRV